MGWTSPASRIDSASCASLASLNTCLGCHGVPGYKNAYPNYSVPKIDGQHPEYIVIALQAYVFTVLTASYVQGALADEH